ncbi:hypothetical protein Airi02_039620 [Actinoallomurus iriomotensis]|uniref:Uncharacterized protein n=2 Tax=Actinoallomurus iriomotensis TaxID=478107 RepID=A0A9W6VUV9_9ACTN|nr:hypothetical protein Airi02_039620 [Actinoallomurus iriomotensis]
MALRIWRLRGGADVNQRQGRNHRELTVPLVHAPLLSGGAAVLAGIGTNAITDVRDSALRFWSGIVFIVAGLIALAGGGAWLLRTLRRSRPWLTRVRLQLRQCAELQQAPDDLTQVQVRVSRLHRVGQRMIRQCRCPHPAALGAPQP